VFRDLRRSLTETEQEKLRAHLAAYMADETTSAVWRAAVNAVAAAPRDRLCRRSTASLTSKHRRALTIAGRGEFTPRRHHSIAIRRQCNSILQAAH